MRRNRLLPEGLNRFLQRLRISSCYPIVVEFIKKLIGKTSETKNIYVQIISWITGLALTMVGWFMNLGFLAEIDWFRL